MVKTRREERREATIQEIKTLAWRQMAENGPANLSLRAVAREMRVSSAALYRYCESRDALLTALSLDASPALPRKSSPPLMQRNGQALAYFQNLDSHIFM